MPKNVFTTEVIELICAIPEGAVCTYGRIATWAGNARGARQVARILHSSGEKEQLPWWRVINAAGHISLPEGHGFEEQRDLLEAEGVEVTSNGWINLDRYGWKPDWTDET
jgi:methylated-DNA-protein-cysteine methyltransferase-like protein